MSAHPPLGALPDQDLLYRASVPAFPGLYDDLTLYVAVSGDHPMPFGRELAEQVANIALHAMLPLGTHMGCSMVGELLDPRQMRALAESRTDGIFRVGGQRGDRLVGQPIFLVPNPAPYLRAWATLHGV